MYATEDGHMYLEGDTSQSERLEISLGSLHRAQDETFFTGTDVVLPVAVERTHTEGTRGAKRWLELHVARRHILYYVSCDYNASPHSKQNDIRMIMSDNRTEFHPT